MDKGIQQSLLSYLAKIEAILFAYADPMPIAKLSEVLGITVSACRQQLEEMSEINKDKNRGLMLVFLDDCVQLVSKKEFSSIIKSSIEQKHQSKLTPVSMEVLAIIAYNQPVTKGFIEQVRGTNSNNIVNSLLEKGLIEEAGRMDIPGKPISYKTTKVFLRSFGLKDLSQLPPLEEDEQMITAQEVFSEHGDDS